VFKLQKSNFNIWNASVEKTPEAIQDQLELNIDHIDPNRTQEDILYEILLKSGFELTTQIETLTLAGKTVYSISQGAMFICLEKEVTKELLKAIADKNPSRVVCLDTAFKGKDADQLKTNAVQIMKVKDIQFRTV
jgi:adenine-specific DNA-methyltransferase